jgi:hypothetical protein
MRKRTIAATSALILATGLGVMFGSTPAHASNNGTEVCEYTVSVGKVVPISPCLDDYNNGGTLVKSYAPGNTWEDFKIVRLSTGGYEIVNDSVGPTECVGDFGNQKGEALATGYDECPTDGDAGWGTVFVYAPDGCPDGGGGLYNNHWHAYLDVSGTSNGEQYYLNTTMTNCYLSFVGNAVDNSVKPVQKVIGAGVQANG